MTWGLVAAAGATLVGTVASGVIGSNASQSAANTQAGAANASTQAQVDMFNKVQGNLQPFINAGQSDYGQLNNLLTGNPQQIQQQLSQMPGYQFTLNQGLKSLQNGYTARGLGVSGAANKGAAQYATGLANSQYNSYFSNLLNAAGLGENAAAGFGNNAVTSGQNIGNSLIAGGNAQASGILGSANAINNSIGGASNAFLTGALLNNGLNGQGPAVNNTPGTGFGFNPLTQTVMQPNG